MLCVYTKSHLYILFSKMGQLVQYAVVIKTDWFAQYCVCQRQQNKSQFVFLEQSLFFIFILCLHKEDVSAASDL